jgi:hypothetical protein
MTYDCDRYAAELVHLLELSQRPGWSPKHAAKLYLEHAYRAGYGAALEDALQRVDRTFDHVKARFLTGLDG